MMILLAAVICWLAGFALLWKIPICREQPDPQPTLGVSIIIPARNEEATLPRLLLSIATQQCRPEQVLVIDDDSTDATAAVARAAGATVISPGPLPDGWRGKTWACQQGATAATAENLLFLDADTWFEPGGLARILHTYSQRPGVLSVIPYHSVPTIAEQLSAFFNLIMTAGIGAFTIFNREPDGLFGQMLLIDRKTYLTVGGHERVKGHVLENLHMAKHLRAEGIALRCASGRGNLSIRMYSGGVADLVRGWTKGFASGAGETSPIVLGLAIAWLSGAVMAAAAALLTRSILFASLYGLFALQLYFMLRRIGSFRLMTALLYPIPLLFFFGVFTNSVAHSGRSVMWKGRAIRAG
jgi:4,4'-diaponeurosporenoate glycosyltransferase